MVNDDNDKWSDNAELPINPTYSSESSEDGQLKEKPKRKALNGRSNDQKELHINSTYSYEKSEQLEEKPKRKTLNSRSNDQKEFSMEELMNGASNDQRVLSMEELMNGSRYKEEPINNLNKNGKSKEEPIRNMTKNGKSKEESTISKTDASTKSHDKDHTKEESIKGLTKNGKSKEESTISKTDESTKSESTKSESTKSESTKSESTKSESKDLTQENQELKEKLLKLKEETNQLKELKEPSYLKDLTKYIKNLDSTIKQLKGSITDLNQSTDAKSWEAISRGSLKVRRYANYYDVADTINTAGASNPNDFDSTVYNVERVFEYLERYAEIMYVANDGTDNLYVIVSHGGRTRFSQEAPIYPGEIKCYFNVYEIRLRSPTAGLSYRVTEYCINNISEISSIPIEKANLHNHALPAVNTNWLSADITPTNYPTTFMIEVAVSIAGNFRAVVTKGGNAQTVTFNVVSGPALIAEGVYIFNLLVHSGDSVNFTYSTTVGTIRLLRVQELDSASA